MPPHKNQLNSDLPHQTLHRIQANSDIHTTTKSISIHTLKPSHFTQKWSQLRPPALKQVNFDTDTETKSISIPHTKNTIISMPLHKNQVNSDQPHKNSTLKSSQLRSPTLKPLYFDHPYKTQVNLDDHSNQIIFGPHTKTKSSPTQKPCQSIPTPKKQVSFGTHTKTKSILIPMLQPGQFPSIH